MTHIPDSEEEREREKKRQRDDAFRAAKNRIRPTEDADDPGSEDQGGDSEDKK